MYISEKYFANGKSWLSLYKYMMNDIHEMAVTGKRSIKLQQQKICLFGLARE